MTAQTQPDQPHYAQPAGGTEHGTVQLVSPLSRRSLLRGAAGAGAVGFAAAAGAGAVIAATRPAAGTLSASTGPATSDKAVTADAVSELAEGEPLVVYLRDIKSGEFEIFNGTRQVKVRNPRLAAELLSGLQTVQ
jgi:hypothetical protein